MGEDDTDEPVSDDDADEVKEALHEIDDDKLPYLVSDLAQSANVNPTLERLRLEDIDISSAEGYPRLGNSASIVACRLIKQFKASVAPPETMSRIHQCHRLATRATLALARGASSPFACQRRRS